MADNIKQEADLNEEINVEEEKTPEEITIPSIIDSITQKEIDNFQPFHKRYFEEKYNTNFTTANRNLDTCIRVHTNKVCVIFLADKHSLFQKKQTIKRLNFQINRKVNRLHNVITGKGKRGAQFLQPDSVLCFIETEDGDVYPIHTGVYGKLLEINTDIISEPSLLTNNSIPPAFVAIILPDTYRFEKSMSVLKTSDEYNI